MIYIFETEYITIEYVINNCTLHTEIKTKIPFDEINKQLIEKMNIKQEKCTFEFGIDLLYKNNLINGLSTFRLDEYEIGKNNIKVSQEINQIDTNMINKDYLKVKFELRKVRPTKDTHIWSVEIIDEKIVDVVIKVMSKL